MNTLFDFDSPLLILFFSIALFMYGIMEVSTSLERLLASKITKLISKLSQGSFLSMVFGLSLTTVLQSSGAVISMLVSLGSARVITLRQVMGVILGTAVGSTLTVQIISFQKTEYALPLFCIGFFGYFFSRAQILKTVFSIMLGFGLVFLGIDFLSQTMLVASAEPGFSSLLGHLQTTPFLMFLICMLISATIHSSAVTIGFLIALSQSHLLTLDQAFYGVLGSNVGTTFTAILASWKANNVAKQVSFAHLAFKFLSVGFFLIPPVHQGLLNVIDLGHFTGPHEIANAHTLVNLVAAILFFPFIEQGAAFIEKIFPVRDAVLQKPQYLKLNTYQSTALALSYAQREILKVSEVVLSTLRDSLKLFEKTDAGLIDSLKSRDSQVEMIFRESKTFLLEQVNKSSTGVHQEIMFFILFLSDLEKISDSVNHNIINLALRKEHLRAQFSQEGWKEICVVHADLCELFRFSIRGFQDRSLASQVIELKRAFAKLEIEMKEHHIERLHRGMQESIITSSIHLDILGELKRISSLICAHAYVARSNAS